MRLSLALGKGVRECMAVVRADEFIYWLAYYKLEPFGTLQEDYRAGTVAAVMSNRWRGEKEKAVGPADFFPSLKPPDEEQPEDWFDTLEGQIALAKGWALAFGGTVD